MKIAIIPIDNRPICYDLIEDTLKIDKNIELFIPNIKDLGGLTTQSNIDNIFDFINNLPIVDFLIVSLDTIAYGGLVSSRRCPENYNTILNRIEKFKAIASKKARKILAFSSVMRISNNNINEEEKEYWSKYGKMIFDWSFESHKNNKKIIHNIPKEIIEDYLGTRKRNFKINKKYLSWAEEGFFDTLIFSKDDCAQFGLNVKEAEELNKLIKEKNITQAKIKTGADEIPLSLISRALCANQNIKIKPIYIENNSKNLISKYEDISVENCINAQIELANCSVDENSDLILLINNFKKEQGDLVLGDIINKINKQIVFPNKPYFIADINNANGADGNLIKQLFEEKTENFYGYCGYNTSANTIGCAIFIAIVKLLAIKNNSYDDKAFKKIEFIRFLDDWGYQSILRKFVRESDPDFIKALEIKKEELNKSSKNICKFLELNINKIDYSLPWNRSFEIRIKID